MCCFVLVSLQVKYAAIALPLMESVLTVPVFSITWQSLTSKNNDNPSSQVPGLAHAVSSFLALGGAGLTGYIVYENRTKDSWEFLILSIVGVLCLNISWIPWILTKTMAIKKRREPEFEATPVEGNSFESDATMSTSTFQSSGYNTSSDSYLSAKNDPNTNILRDGYQDVPPDSDPEEQTTKSGQFLKHIAYSESESHWKTLMISSFTKSVFVVPFSIAINFLVPMIDIKEFPSGWDWVEFDDTATLFVVNIVTSLLSYGFAVFASRTCMDKGSFVLPMAIAPVFVFLLLFFGNSCDFGLTFGLVLYADTAEFCEIPDDVTIFLVIAVLLFWIARNLSFLWMVFKRKSIVLQKEPKVS